MGAKAAQPERARAWDGVLRREVPVTLRVLDKAERTIEVIASTEALDAHGDVVKQFWDLKRYNANGPALWNHNQFESSAYSFGGAVRPEDLMPVGKGVAQVESNKLSATLTLVKGTAEEEPLVDKLWRRIEQGVIKAVSVGFRPGAITKVTNAAGITTHYELGTAERPNELMEISFVAMGSNPEAVAKSVAWEREQLRHLVAPTAAEGGFSKKANIMDPELQKALEAKATAEEKLKAASAALDTASIDLKAEKATNTKLEKDLGEARDRIKALDTELKTFKDGNSKLVLDGLQGVKFAPAEREELDKLLVDVGLDRVKSLLDKRPDMALTQGVKVEGKSLDDKGNPAPALVDDSTADATADIAKTASARATKAA